MDIDGDEVKYVDHDGDKIKFLVFNGAIRKYVNGRYKKEVSSFSYNESNHDLRD